jgi:hypothetical protein
MLGIIFGTLCLFALAKVVRGRRYWRHGRHGYGYGFFLRRIFQRLNTGPGQEKVVLGEIDALRETARELRAELKNTRADIAAILREPTFDKGKLEALYRKQDELLAKLRSAASSSFEKVHAALDDRQKADLADMIERAGFNRYAHYGYGC